MRASLVSVTTSEFFHRPIQGSWYFFDIRQLIKLILRISSMAVCEDRVSVNLSLAWLWFFVSFRYDTGCDMSATVCMGKHV